MKILSVEIEGFGPFKEPQSVDFTAFDDFGIFLIGGRTGSGKSTVLDAICFALYGSVPRYDGYSGSARLRSDHCEIDDITRVTLIFEAGDERYRIVRSPDYARPKKVGIGVTEQKASVELALLTAVGWEGLETRASEVADRVSEIVKLNKKQFLQVILLAQNRFQEFLEAQSEDRQALLRTLFGTERFEDYAKSLYARAQALGDQLDGLSAGAERTVEQLARTLEIELPAEGEDRVIWADRSTQVCVRAGDAARDAEREAIATANRTNSELRAAEHLAERQQRRHDAAAQLARLEARTDAYAQERARLQAATAAAGVRSQLTTFDGAGAAMRAAHEAEVRARRAAEPLPLGEIADAVTQLISTLAVLDAALETERRLPQLDQSARAAAAALVAHDQAAASIELQRTALRERLSELADDFTEAEAGAKELAAAETNLKSIRSAHQAALQAAYLDARVQRLKTAEISALDERTAATVEEARLRTAQLRGRAASLARGLVDGDPCPVCGAAEHPQPANFESEPVTDEQVDRARARLEQARTTVEDAARELGVLTAEVAEMRGAAGGKDSATLERELETAREQLVASQSAQMQLLGIGKERAAIVAQQSVLDQQERTATASRTALVHDEALRTKEHADAQVLVAQAREGDESVAARVEVLTGRRVAFEQLREGRSELARATAAAESAELALSAALAQHGFPDRQTAERVMLAEPEREQLAQAVRAHEDGLLQSRAVLEQDDLQDLPLEPAAVDAARERAQAAENARQERTAARATLAEREFRARELTSQLAGELERTADLRRRHTLLDGLSGALRGDSRFNQPGIPLESFVLAAELEEIVAAANQRLRSMSQGRYLIEHSDERTRGGKRTGLEILVYDAHTGSSRSPRSLSGGEKFLASLALALGLAEVVTSRAGGIRLDTLFIDEGFGSLDDETLEVAMQTLDELRQGGRTVGLISHVDAMKDQIPAKLLVDVADGGWSVIKQAA